MRKARESYFMTVNQNLNCEMKTTFATLLSRVKGNTSKRSGLNPPLNQEGL